jgi:uracil-DNA glycosylase
MFAKIAEAGFYWFQEELRICSPKLIITLGEDTAKALSGLKKPPLDGLIRPFPRNEEISIVHLAHPEIFRRNEKWRNATIKHLNSLKKHIKNYL